MTHMYVHPASVGVVAERGDFSPARSIGECAGCVLTNRIARSLPLHTHPAQLLLKRKHRVLQALRLDFGPGVQYQCEQIERFPERDTQP